MFGIVLCILLILSPVLFFFRTEVFQLEYLIIELCLFWVGSIRWFSNNLRRKNFTVSIIDLAFVMWVVCYFLSMLRTETGTLDFTASMLFIGNVFIYFLARNILKRARIQYFILIIIISAFSQLFFAYCFQHGGFNSYLHFRGNFFNSGLFAGYLSVGIIAIMGGWPLFPVQAGSLRNKIWSGVVLLPLAVLMLIAVFYVQSRAAWLALGAGILYLLQDRLKIAFKKVQQKGLRLLGGMLSLLLVVCLMIYLYSLKPDSANGRLLIWQAGLNLFSERPLLGWGFDGFRRNYMYFQEKILQQGAPVSYESLASDNAFAFNEFLKIGTEQGVIGLAVFLILIGLLFAVRYNITCRREVLLLKAIVLVILVFGCFSYPSEAVPFHVLTVGSVAGLAGMVRKQYIVVGLLYRKIVCCVFVVLILAGGYVSFHTWHLTCVANEYQKILKKFSGQDEEFFQLRALYPRLRTTIDYLAFYGEEANSYGRQKEAAEVLCQLGRCYPTAFQQKELGKALESLGDYQGAELALLHASGMVPALIGPHYLLAGLYERMHRYADARVQANIVLDKKTKVYTPEIYYMRKEMKQKLDAWKQK